MQWKGYKKDTTSVLTTDHPIPHKTIFQTLLPDLIRTQNLPPNHLPWSLLWLNWVILVVSEVWLYEPRGTGWIEIGNIKRTNVKLDGHKNRFKILYRSPSIKYYLQHVKEKQTKSVKSKQQKYCFHITFPPTNFNCVVEVLQPQASVCAKRSTTILTKNPVHFVSSLYFPPVFLCAIFFHKCNSKSSSSSIT